MKHLRTSKGPFAERPFYELHDIERICEDELRAAELFPRTPEPIRIDRFVEKRFGVDPRYDDLPAGVLGYTKFGQRGVEAIVLSRALDEERSTVADRRIRTTLAHESGHGLLHGHLFALGASLVSLFEGEMKDTPGILCRDIPISDDRSRTYDGRWWEFQANRAMGSLLLPRPLAAEALKPFLILHGSLGQKSLDQERKDEAVRALSDMFDVNPAVSRIRINDIYPPEDSRQMSL